jgi:excinuclease ABC subunit B
VAEEVIEYAAMSPADLNKEIKQLEQQMYEHAQNLEFEDAARLRDKIKHVQEAGMGLPQSGAV